MTRAIKAARKFIAAQPDSAAAKTLADLVLSLEEESPFQLNGIYELPPEQFTLAIQILEDWRVDRYYLGKAKLFDLSWQHRALRGAVAE